MKIVLTVLVAVGLVTGGRADAQARLAALEVPPFATAADTAAFSARFTQAMRALGEGRVSAARRELEAVARAQEEAGLLPDLALWQLAEVHYARGDVLRAAATLDRLALAADRHGDPVTQARALFEAVVHYQSAGLRNRARDRYQRMVPLLQSPFMPARLRESLRARIVMRP